MNQFDQSIEKKKAKEINLKEIYKVIHRRLWALLILTLIGASIGFLKDNVTITPLYQTSSRVIIGADQTTITTLQVIVTDPTILDKVVKELNVKTTSDVLAKEISVASINNSQVVSITVVDKDPKLAAQIANTTAKVFKEEEPKIIGQNNIRLLSDAQVNPVPINPQSSHKVYTYGLIGLVVGIGLAFLLDSLDNTVRTEQEIENVLGFTMLGKVSKINKKNVKRNKSKIDLQLRGEPIDFN